MPTLSQFLGIAIRVYPEEQGPLHFHAYYGHQSAVFEIETLHVTSGHLPRRVQALVLEWAFLHREELRENWRRAAAHEPLSPIDPLE
jgi:hypothetical protein